MTREPVKMLSKEWARIKASPVTIFGTVPANLYPHAEQGIPMDKHIEELIRIPQVESDDFLYEYRTRFLPQKYDYKSQFLLRKYSNNIAEGLNETRARGRKPTAVNKFLLDFCNEIGTDFNYFEYCCLTMQYFQHLLPQVPIVSREQMRLIKDLGGDRTLGFKSDPNYYSRYIQTTRRVLSRFSFLHEMETEIKTVMAMIEEAGKTEKFEAFKWDNFQSLITEGDLRHQRIIPEKRRNSLRQCIFCYRFFEGVGRVTRTCGDKKCSQADNAWTTSLDVKGVSLESLGFLNRSSKENG